MSNVQTVEKPLAVYLSEQKAQIQKALPKHMSSERMVRIFLTEVRKNEKLAKCTSMSLLSAMIQTSQLGLEPGNGLGYAYLIPYGKEATLQIGYKGLMDLARRSGSISSITTHCVYEQDMFEIEYGIEEKFKHVPTRGSRGEIIAAYAVARLKDGGHQLEFMWRDEIDKIKESAQSVINAKKYGKQTPWDTNYDQMAKKTVIRRLCKYLSLSPEFNDAMNINSSSPVKEEADPSSSCNEFGGETFDVNHETGEIVDKDELTSYKKPSLNGKQFGEKISEWSKLINSGATKSEIKELAQEEYTLSYEQYEIINTLGISQ
ncbi:MAG: recombinase RecT [Methylococcales bacterium]|jgi:recombination protein RecT|nr:recombinase RecT [Methylococcales bacterium]MBT7410861.1 recombinase RecT [Methylococcales bacterium]